MSREHLAVITHVGGSTVITPLGDIGAPTHPIAPEPPGTPDQGLPGTPDRPWPRPWPRPPGAPDNSLPVEPPAPDNTLPAPPPVVGGGPAPAPPTITLPTGAFILVWVPGVGLKWAHVGAPAPDQGLPPGAPGAPDQGLPPVPPTPTPS
jgi:hypothetical protein